MKRAYLSAAVSFLLTLSHSLAEPPKALYPDVAPVCSCESLKKLSLPNTTIESSVIDPRDGSCRVTATVTHPPTGDRVRVFIALPTKGWRRKGDSELYYDISKLGTVHITPWNHWFWGINCSSAPYVLFLPGEGVET
jgi:hypothetical protein